MIKKKFIKNEIIIEVIIKKEIIIEKILIREINIKKMKNSIKEKKNNIEKNLKK